MAAVSDPHAHWLEAIAAGDEAMMRRVYDAYADAVYAFALRRLAQPADAADVLHEVMLEVWRKAGSYQGRSRVRTWLLGIAHHKVLDRLRLQTRRREREDENADPCEQLAATAGPQAAMAGASDARWVRHCLEKLSTTHRQVMHLVFFQELSYPEIADILQCPVGTVKTRMLHARRRMQHCLETVGVADALTE